MSENHSDLIKKIVVSATNKEDGGTDGRKVYFVRLWKDCQTDCTCKGFHYRRKCKHHTEHAPELVAYYNDHERGK